MDYSQDFTALHGVMVSADNVHCFSRLSAKAGNEEKFEYIFNSVQKFLGERNYINKNGIIEGSIENLRKLSLFLILNADLEALKDMLDIEDLEMLIWMLPTISKCLLCEMFWRLHFDKFVYETIAFCSPDLSLELATAFIDHIKYSTPLECISKLKIISGACYVAVCRLHFYKYDNNMSYLLTMHLNNFQKCINYFSDPPKMEKLNSLSKDDQYKYKGKCLHTMLLLVQECLEKFTSTPEIYPRNIGYLYTLTHLKDSKLNEFNCKTCDSPHKLILDCIDKFNEALLDKFQQLVMEVSVDIFCAWSEFFDNDKSMQQTIGELCYVVRNKLLECSLREHPVVSMIVQIACKPIDLVDIVKAADNETIVDNINKNSEDKAAWLLALIQKDDLSFDEKLVECLSAHINILNQQECIKLYKVIKNFISSHPKGRVDLELLAIQVFRGCDKDAQLELLHEHFCNKCFVNMSDNIEFTTMMNETFNKLIMSPNTDTNNSDTSNILTLFLQNPKEVYRTIFYLASENVKQRDIMLRVMKLLESFANHYYSEDTEACIILVTQESLTRFAAETQVDNFVNFICGLKDLNCITGAKLLMLIVMPNLHKALLSKDMNSLHTQMKLLKNVYELEELMQYRAPLLAMLAQVLDTVRWRITTYVPFAPAALQLTLDLQKTLFATYEQEFPVNENNWLKNKVKNVHPLNMYYYRKLWNPPGNSYAEIISGKQIHSETSTEQLATWISQIICSSTREEWCELWDSLKIFPDRVLLDIFHDAMSLLTIAEGANRTPETWACLLYCYRNFVYVIRYKFFKAPLQDSQVSSVVDKITVTANLMEEDNVADLATVLLPLFSYMAEMKNDYKMNISMYLHDKLRHAKFADTIRTVFSNGAAS